MVVEITPSTWPPNISDPAEMDYPTGKAVSLAKSVIVVKYGKMLNPNKAAPMYMTQLLKVSMPVNINPNAIAHMYR